MLAVRSGIPCQLIDSPSELEIVCVKLNYSQPVVCCLTYIPLNSSITQYENLFNFLNSTNIGSVNLIVLGTLIPQTLIGTHYLVFLQFLVNFGILFLIQSYLNLSTVLLTHIHGNILDLLLNNFEELIQCISVDPQSSLLLSDHYSIIFIIALTKPPTKTSCYYTFNYSKGNYDGLHEYLLYSDFSFCFQSHNVEAVWLYIEDVINTAMRLYIPFTKFYSHQHPPWFTSDTRHHNKRLHTLRRKFRLYPSDEMAAKIESLKVLLQEKITLAKNSYESSLINDFALANSNKIYSYIRNIFITKSRSIPSTVHFDSLTASSDSDKAGLFNQYFHSVFINTSSSPSIDDLPDLSHTVNSVEFTEMEVYDALRSLDPYKASGIDDILPRIL